MVVSKTAVPEQVVMYHDLATICETQTSFAAADNVTGEHTEPLLSRKPHEVICPKQLPPVIKNM